jgi:sugar O-acyltransferase (sialic acid O-acetyltransferase NeuD family)
MKDLIILGAGGFGIEALEIAETINRTEKKWNIKGFLDPNSDALIGKDCKYPILGNDINWIPNNNEVFVIGIANPHLKEKIVLQFKNKGAQFETLISPNAVIQNHVIIGEGCVIGTAWITAYAKIGNYVHVAGSMIGSGSIGDFSTTTGFANLTNAKIGKCVFIGSHAVILNNLTVGDYSYIGAGSIVIKNVKSNTKVFGNPAKKIEY